MNIRMSPTRITGIPTRRQRYRQWALGAAAFESTGLQQHDAIVCFAKVQYSFPSAVFLQQQAPIFLPVSEHV